MRSLRCLISALTQAGGGDLLLRFASSVRSCCGEGGALQADVAVCGEHSPGSLQFWRPLPGCCAPFRSTASSPGSQGFGALSTGAPRLFPPRRAARAARGLVPSPRARRAFSLRGPSARRRAGLRKSSDRTRGLFAGWEGVASLGLSLPLSPPPASYLQRGWAGSSLEFLSPFVLRTAGGVFPPVNFSLALPQFKKISL